LRVWASRPSRYGLEMHLAMMYQEVVASEPSVVVVDPISNFISAGSMSEAETMLVRLVDFLKMKGVTTLFTNLTQGGATAEHTDLGISSIIDTWLLLREAERDEERYCSLYILKSRGMWHSRQVRELRMTDRGIELAEHASKAAAPRAAPQAE
jgi:circadian clock protein KaiC